MKSLNKTVKITIETFILVAVWDYPFIIQGCFKIYEQHKSPILLFFRCQSSYSKQADILHCDFSPYHYDLTHLYNEAGLINHGLNLFKNDIEDTFSAGIVEPLKVKTQAITSASEVATMILRIDDVLISSNSQAKTPINPNYEGMD